MPLAVQASHAQPVDVSRILASQSPEWRSRELLLKAIEVLGDASKAQAWLLEANASLDDRRPVDLAEGSDAGYEEAYAVLGRIEYGVYP